MERRGALSGGVLIETMSGLDYIQGMERNGNIDATKVELVGTYRTFGADGILYEVLGIEADDPRMAEILVVETGERTHYPLDQLIADPVAR